MNRLPPELKSALLWATLTTPTPKTGPHSRPKDLRYLHPQISINDFLALACTCRHFYALYKSEELAFLKVVVEKIFNGFGEVKGPGMRGITRDWGEVRKYVRAFAVSGWEEDSVRWYTCVSNQISESKKEDISFIFQAPDYPITNLRDTLRTLRTYRAISAIAQQSQLSPGPPSNPPDTKICCRKKVIPDIHEICVSLGYAKIIPARLITPRWRVTDSNKLVNYVTVVVDRHVRRRLAENTGLEKLVDWGDWWPGVKVGDEEIERLDEACNELFGIGLREFETKRVIAPALSVNYAIPTLLQLAKYYAQSATLSTIYEFVRPSANDEQRDGLIRELFSTVGVRKKHDESWLEDQDGGGKRMVEDIMSCGKRIERMRMSIGEMGDGEESDLGRDLFEVADEAGGSMSWFRLSRRRNAFYSGGG